MPGAEEVISYHMPAYKLDGRVVLYFAGRKQHYSLYPATGHVVAAFLDDLAPYEISKGTIRFPLSKTPLGATRAAHRLLDGFDRALRDDYIRE